METSETDLSALSKETLRDLVRTLQRQLEREKRYNSDLIKENEALKSGSLRNGISFSSSETQTDFISSVHGEEQWSAQAKEQGGSIADSVRSFLSAKNSEIERKEFVYNEALGMYVNTRNGVMYDGKRFCVYDYQKNVYLFYDEATGEYKEDPSTSKSSNSNKKKKRKRKPSEDNEEDGSILSSSSEEEEGQVDEENPESEHSSESYPPCVRIIVFRSTVLAPGDLFIATCDRSFVIGRDSKRDMRLDEDSVSKYHAVISYDKDTCEYQIQDMGSQNGTLLNGFRLSEAKAISEKKKLEHLDVAVIGSTILVFHIHDKLETCDNCEPGVVRSWLQGNGNIVANIINNVTDFTLREMHKKELSNLKRKYGLQSEQYVAQPVASSADYVDRSRVRRQFVGSEHPSTERQEIESASVHVPIGESNKGFQLLSKMGWNEGEGLNSKRRNDSINQPLAPMLRLNETAGLGSEEAVNLSMDDVRIKQHKEKWAKTAKRYHGLPTVNIPVPGESRSGTTVQWVRGGVANLSQDQTDPSNQPTNNDTAVKKFMYF